MSDDAAGRGARRVAPSVRAWLTDRRVFVAIVATAFLLRLAFDLFLHPPYAYRFSDMRSYLERADGLAEEPWSSVDPMVTFFPYGTHVFAYLVRVVFGRDGAFGIALVLAALGAGVVSYWTAIAARLLAAHRWAWIALGVSFALHVQLIWIGGNVLSEIPFAFLLAASAFHALRWLQTGSLRDALAAGAAIALSATFRPQAGLSFVLLAGALAWHRGALPKPSRRGIAVALAPLLLVSAISAARIHHHTGGWGWISTNAAFNFALGRCHCLTLRVKPDGDHYQPPSFQRLLDFEKKHGYAPIVDLDPVLGETITVRAHLWDEGDFWALSARCVRASGPLAQAKFAATHVLLLWAYNLPWPTTGALSDACQVIQVLLLPGLLIALWRARRGGQAPTAILGAHVLALFATAALFFGESRLRVPYDGFIGVLAMTVYAPAAERWFSRRLPGSASSARDESPRS